MKFIWKCDRMIAGSIVYRVEEHSIDFIKASDHSSRNLENYGVGSISIGTLQLEVALGTGQVMFPWGLFPRSRWTQRRMRAPEGHAGQLFFVEHAIISPGCASDVPGGKAWPTFFDNENGWLYTGVDIPAEFVVEFATNVWASLLDGELIGLWMKPMFV